MTLQSDMLARMRLELGDQPQDFELTAIGDGQLLRFNLPVGRVEPTGFSVQLQHSDGSSDLLDPAQDYSLDVTNGVITLASAPAYTDTLIAQGTTWGMFTDTELLEFLTDAMMQHNYGRTIETRVLNTATGFINYTYVAVDYTNIPQVEVYPVVLLATIEALWALATDASTDVDISTADGTSVPRSQRFQQLTGQIERLQARYDWFREQLNVGLGRVEMFNLRRVSRTTNRLVPLYVEREYDDNSPPRRILPPIDSTNVDPNAGLYPDYGYWGGSW